jgi:hypothetical protein
MSKMNWPLIGAVVVISAIILALYSTAWARDTGQWENEPESTRTWFRNLMQPDNPSVSCCGDSDAYWCDDVFIKRNTKNEKQTYCKITDDRPDEPRNRRHIEIGTEFEIPSNKIKYSDSDPQLPKTNPTGHAIIFLSRGDYVYCFVQGGGV